MGYQTIGVTGAVTSWGASGADVHQLINAGISPASISAEISSDGLDWTGLGVSSAAMRAGLASWTATIVGRYPKTAPKVGNSGGVTFAGGYATWVRSWELTIEAGVHDITSQTGSAVLWRSFRPGLLSWSGSYECDIDSTTPLSPPTLASGVAGAATFKISEEGATDNTLAGDIIVTGLSQSVSAGEKNTASYSFSGSGVLTNTYASGMGLLSASASPYAIGTPTWDVNGDGVPDVVLTWQSDTGRTYAGPAFWRSLRVSCPVDGLIEVTVGVQGAGALTIS